MKKHPHHLKPTLKNVSVYGRPFFHEPRLHHGDWGCWQDRVIFFNHRSITRGSSSYRLQRMLWCRIQPRFELIISYTDDSELRLDHFYTSLPEHRDTSITQPLDEAIDGITSSTRRESRQPDVNLAQCVSAWPDGVELIGFTVLFVTVAMAASFPIGATAHCLGP